ncbi:MAG TPA: hypothetical protein VIW64_19370 [Pyrinomonadaceae bacterium]
MTIRGEYLWDKTGEPDPEIQELEEILGALRYRPRALEIPADVEVGQGRKFFRSHAPSLAIAATVAMLLFGLGLWLGLQRWQRNQPVQLTHSGPGSSPSVREGSVATPPIQESASVVLPPHREASQTQLAKNKRARSVRVNDQQLAIARRQEAEAAKDQLMLAFRLVSAKLNYAQKKAQELNQKEPVHNQHKIG